MSKTLIALLTVFLLTFFGPILFLVLSGIRGRSRYAWLALGLGAAGFFVPQMMLRLPVLSVLQSFEAVLEFGQSHTLLYTGILACTAALFETTGRYFAARLMKAHLNGENAIRLGIGHGCIEALSLVGITYLINLLVLAVGSGIPALQEAHALILGTSPGLFLLAGLERILAVCFHIGLSAWMAYWVVRERPLYGWLLCLVLHTALDCCTVLANEHLALFYLMFAIVAAASLTLALLLGRKASWEQVRKNGRT